MKLADWLNSSTIPNKEFAHRVGIGRSTLWRICSGDQEPSLTVAFRIEAETGGLVRAHELRKVSDPQP